MLDLIRDHLAGAWAVMNGRAEGFRRLDISIEGFWRSFGAILLVLPLAFLTTIAVIGAGAPDDEAVAPGGEAIFAELLATSIDWVAFPLLFAALARPLGVASRFAPYIVVRNWGSTIVAAIYAVAVLPYAFGLLSSEALGIVLLVVFGIALRFAYLVARTALLVPPTIAIPIVVLEVLVAMVIGFGIDRLL